MHEWMKAVYALNNSNVFDAYSHDSSRDGKSELTTLAIHIKLTLEMLVVPPAVSKTQARPRGLASKSVLVALLLRGQHGV